MLHHSDVDVDVDKHPKMEETENPFSDGDLFRFGSQPVKLLGSLIGYISKTGSFCYFFILINIQLTSVFWVRKLWLSVWRDNGAEKDIPSDIYNTLIPDDSLYWLLWLDT